MAIAADEQSAYWIQFKWIFSKLIESEALLQNIVTV